MASEWIKLTKDETNEFVYLNLAKASSIFRAMGEGRQSGFFWTLAKMEASMSRRLPRRFLPV